MVIWFMIHRENPTYTSQTINTHWYKYQCNKCPWYKWQLFINPHWYKYLLIYADITNAEWYKCLYNKCQLTDTNCYYFLIWTVVAPLFFQKCLRFYALCLFNFCLHVKAIQSLNYFKMIFSSHCKWQDTCKKLFTLQILNNLIRFK